VRAKLEADNPANSGKPGTPGTQSASQVSSTDPQRQTSAPQGLAVSHQSAEHSNQPGVPPAKQTMGNPTLSRFWTRADGQPEVSQSLRSSAPQHPAPTDPQAIRSSVPESLLGHQDSIPMPVSPPEVPSVLAKPVDQRIMAALYKAGASPQTVRQVVKAVDKSIRETQPSSTQDNSGELSSEDEGDSFTFSFHSTGPKADESRAIHWAARYGHTPTVQTLARTGGADLNCCSHDGITPLMRAARYGHVEVVRALVHEGADRERKDADGCTALMWAARAGRVDALLALCAAGVELDVQDDRGWTAVMMAANNWQTEVVSILVEKQADITLENQEGRSALQIALDNAKSMACKDDVVAALGSREF